MSTLKNAQSKGSSFKLIIHINHQSIALPFNNVVKRIKAKQLKLGPFNGHDTT